MGASINSNYPTEYASTGFQEAVKELANDHANYVTLVIPLEQADDHSSAIQTSPTAPTTAALTAGVSYAHQLGLKVNLKIVLYVASGGWRAYISASDPNAWFQSYGQMLQTYADFAQQNSVEEITIGSELVKMTAPAYTQQWESLIQDIRSRYSGKLTYSANWGTGGGNGGWTDEVDQIQFWGDLDYIGISAYYPFNPPYTVDSLVQQWAQRDQQAIGPLHEKYNKPVLFTETGYRSLQDNLHTPWDYTSTGAEDQNAQATGFEAMFQYWSGVSYFAGVQIWDWHSMTSAYWSSPDQLTSYSPQHKAAEQVIAKWFAKGPHEQVSTVKPPPTRAPLAPSTPGQAQPPAAEPTPAADAVLSWQFLI